MKADVGGPGYKVNSIVCNGAKEKPHSPLCCIQKKKAITNLKYFVSLQHPLHTFLLRQNGEMISGERPHFK